MFKAQTKRFARLASRAASMPWNGVSFRIRQMMVLGYLHQTRRWKAFARHAERRVAALSSLSSQPTLLSPTNFAPTQAQISELADCAQKVMRSDFSIFGVQVPDLEVCDFSTDWRFQQRWAPQYFKRYRFYVAKTNPYDVKFPWELSRLHYLVPVLAFQLAQGASPAVVNWVHRILQRWRAENPLAYSVNWYPMEASMRAINLAIMLDLVRKIRLRVSGEASHSELDGLSRLLLVMLLEHAHFVWLNREYTDVRGNHFAANLVALLLAGKALAAEGLGQSEWTAYAGRLLPEEALLQFCADGVNFEKACGYHKLVLELFLLGAIALSRSGSSIPVAVSSRLIAAARFSEALMRPDDCAAGFGDSDDAIGLPFALGGERSHGAVIQLARSWFDEPIGSYRVSPRDQLASVLLAGSLRDGAEPMGGVEVLPFLEGGYVVVRNRRNGFHLIADVGEVGMSGRGGHGHNDLLAFEMCVDSVPVVVDPGCSGYTSDLDKKSRYRSTAAHSTVQLYGEEMARFAGDWDIHNDAVPFDVRVQVDGDRIRIIAGHMGYARLHPGTRVLRTWEIDAEHQCVELIDHLELPVAAPVVWRFPAGVVSIDEVDASQMLRHSRYRSTRVHGPVRFDIALAPYSAGYGKEQMGQVLVGSLTAGPGQVSFRTKFEAVESTPT